jgi:hypothetical protein
MAEASSLQDDTSVHLDVRKIESKIIQRLVARAARFQAGANQAELASALNGPQSLADLRGAIGLGPITLSDRSAHDDDPHDNDPHDSDPGNFDRANFDRDNFDRDQA